MRVFSEMKFKQETNLYQALEQTKNCMCTDKQLPVKVEAAIALQMLISDQDKGKDTRITKHLLCVATGTVWSICDGVLQVYVY